MEELDQRIKDALDWSKFHLWLIRVIKLHGENATIGKTSGGGSMPIAVYLSDELNIPRNRIFVSSTHIRESADIASHRYCDIPRWHWYFDQALWFNNREPSRGGVVTAIQCLVALEKHGDRDDPQEAIQAEAAGNAREDQVGRAR